MAAARKKNRARAKKRTATAAPRSSATGRMATGFAAMTGAQKVAWACLHALVLAVPLAMSNWTWLPGVHLPFTFDQFDIVKVFVQRGITLVAFGAWAWHVLVNGGTVRRTKVDYLILAVLGWFALSAIFSIHPPTAVFGKYRRFEGLLSFITYATMFFLAVQFLDRLSRVRSLARTLFVSGTLVSLYGVLQYLGIDPLTWGRLPFEESRSFSTYGNPNLLGGFIVFPLVISLALALSEKDHRWRIAYSGGFFVTVVCWITAFTRGAWIGGAVGLAIIIFAAWRMRTRLTRGDWIFSGGIAAVAAFVVVRSLGADDPVMNVSRRLVSIFEFERGSALTRFQIWDSAWRATLDRPVLGFGLDTFRLLFPGYKPIEYTQTAGYISVADNVHNYVLQMMTAVGIPGVLLLYGLFLTVAALSARNAFARPDPGQDNSRLVLSGFWAASAAYITHLSFGLSVTGSTFLLWIAMAALLAPIARTVDVRPPTWGVFAAAGVLALVLVASVGNIVYIAADNAYLKARLGGAYERRLANAETAVRRNPYNDMYRAEVGLAHSDGFSQLVSQARSTQMQGGDPGPLMTEAEVRFRRAEQSFLETIEFVEWEYDNYVFLASLYNNGAETLSREYNQKALAIARRGIEVSEFGPAIRVQYAIALGREGNLDEAEQQMRYAVEMDHRFLESHLLLANILEEQGEYEEALEYYEKVRALNPDFPEIDSIIEEVETSAGVSLDQ